MVSADDHSVNVAYRYEDTLAVAVNIKTTTLLELFK
jgi:hypothetical protein